MVRLTFSLLLGVFIGLNIADVLITKVGLELGLVEGNPLGHIPLLKPVTITIVVILMAYLRHLTPRGAFWVLIIFNLVYVAVVIWNLAQISLHLKL